MLTRMAAKWLDPSLRRRRRTGADVPSPPAARSCDTEKAMRMKSIHGPLAFVSSFVLGALVGCGGASVHGDAGANTGNGGAAGTQSGAGGTAAGGGGAGG